MKWEVLEDTQPQPESPIGSALRYGAQTAASVGETLGNLPHDISHGVLGLARLGESASTGLQKALGVEKLLDTGTSLPTSLPIPKFGSLAKEAVGKVLPKDYLEPQAGGEKKWSEFVSDITSLLTPVPGVGKLSKAKAIGVAGSGQLAKWAAEEIGAGEGAQAGLKAGAMLASSMLGPTGLKQYRKKLYDAAEDAITPSTYKSELFAPSTMVSANKLQPIVDDLGKKLKKGYLTPNKKELNKSIHSLKNKIKNNEISVDEVWEFKRNINEVFGDPQKLEGAEKLVGALQKGLNETLTEYGKKNKPFLKAFREAEDITRGMKKASPVNKFLQKHVSPANIGKVTGGVLLGYVPPSTAIKGVGTAVTAREAVKGFEAIKNSPAIRKYYSSVIADAVAKNAPQLAKDVAKLDRAITDMYPDQSGKWEVLE
jgi:hypothetical protein